MGSKKSQPQQTTGTQTTQQLSSPSLEAALSLYTPQLMGMLSGNIQTDTFAPRVAAQNQLQQAAITSALRGQGFNYDPGTGQVTGTGIGAYQPFLDAAGQAAGQIQGAGAGALSQAQAALNQQQALAQGLSASTAASPFMQKASTAADAAQAAAAAGQGAGDADFAAARGFTGPGAYEQFMSPYQQEVIDSTMADYQQQLGQQQAQLGASAGSAFGGSRQAVAQAELMGQGARGMAGTLANLRQQGFGQANQLAAQAFQQANQQALQNQQMYGAAGAAQQGMAGQAQQQLANTLAQYGGLSAAEQGMGQYDMSMLGNRINALSQMGSQNQAYQQSLLDAERQGLRESAFSKQQGLGFLGQMLGAAYGAPGGTTFTTTPDPSTMQTLFGAGTGILGLLGAGGFFNKGQGQG